MKTALPLCVDLDGTLIYRDTTWLAFVTLLRKNPFYLPRCFLWLLKGRACLKQKMARKVNLEIAQLPYQRAFLDYLLAEKSRGREIILISATDQRIAQSVADYLGIFSLVLASDGRTNLKSAAKRDALIQRYGRKQFVYAGNESADYKVWEAAAAAIVVNAPAHVLKKCRTLAALEKIF